MFKKKMQSHEDRIAAMVKELKKKEPNETQADENNETPDQEDIENKFGIEQGKPHLGDGLINENEDMTKVGEGAPEEGLDKEEMKKGKLFGTPQKHEVHIKISLHGKK